MLIWTDILINNESILMQKIMLSHSNSLNIKRTRCHAFYIIKQQFLCFFCTFSSLMIASIPDNTTGIKPRLE